MSVLTTGLPGPGITATRVRGAGATAIREGGSPAGMPSGWMTPGGVTVIGSTRSWAPIVRTAAVNAMATTTRPQVSFHFIVRLLWRLESSAGERSDRRNLRQLFSFERILTTCLNEIELTGARNRTREPLAPTCGGGLPANLA